MESGFSSGKRKPWPKDEFTELVFSMSLEHIFDDNLYKHQIEKIPESFESVDQYLSSYVYPLLEESRAEIASAVETVYKAPIAEVTFVTELKSERCVYDVKIDHWENKVSGYGKEPYRTLPGDLVMLSNSKPESSSDLQRLGWKFTFASVINITDDDSGDSCTTTNFRLKTANQIEDSSTDSLYVIFLTNITTNKRIWNALRMRKNLSIIENVLSKNELDEEDCRLCSRKCDYQMDVTVGSTQLLKLNESQNEAISASLLIVECNHKSSVQLIWGPPGTGKTRTLSVLLYTLLKMNVRTLICAPTNVAITELATRVIKLVKDSYEAELGKGFQSCPLGDILIFGNKDNLKVGSDIKEIFLDHRLDRLVECLGGLTGWNHCVTHMIDFLKNCVSQYHVYVDNELIIAKEKANESSQDEIEKKEKANESLQDEIEKIKLKSILEFGRERFKHTAFPLRRSMLAFLTHIPKTNVLEQNFQYMVQVMSLLDSIEALLFEDNMTSEEFENVFSKEGRISGSSSLSYMISHCLSILTSLHYSLANLDLPRVTDGTISSEFCFKNASLIFCTTSSAFKLHSVDMEPLNLLVIDEAAQVKESESVIALQVPGIRHAILVGDEWQLPATVSSKMSEEAGFGRSLFQRLSSLGHSKHLLNMQYRMHPSISRFPNSNFYLNQILDAPSVVCQSYERCYLEGRMFGPYSFINIRGGKEEFDEVGRSRRNMVEVAVIVKLIQKLFKAWNGSKEKLSIGVISPYAAQVAAIKDKLKKKYENLERFMVKVKTVDGFQGAEDDVIIISTVRSNNGGSIGFLSSPQRTNVALTRARHCLWILGNARTLSMSNSVWEALVVDAKNRQCFFTADGDNEIAKTIIDVKKELEQLEDLLNEDNVLFKNARWKVLFSDNFKKSFGKLKHSHVKKLVLNMILKLASGWRPKKINVDWTCESSSHIVKQFKVEGYYVVCSIDIMKESIYKQVLKVWDILLLVEIPKLLKRLDNIFAMYTDDFTNLCKETCKEGNLEVPKIWSTLDEIVRFKNLNNTDFGIDASACVVDSRSYAENSRVNESLLLMKFYSLSTGAVNHLLSDHENNEMELPFEVTDEEREIIIFPRSSFILGRSGTGKTTILTMKLYRNLQQYCIASGDSIDVSHNLSEYKETNLHQLFVTVSPKLCYAVKKHVSQLKRFASGNFSTSNNFTEMDDIDEMAEFKDIPDTFVGIQQEKYPLIITFHKFIMMLDGTLGTSYFQRFCQIRDSSQVEGRRSVALQTFIRKNEVTYDRFLSSYWPHFNAKMTKNLDPSRVFTEIMSHIKGGLQGEEASCDSKLSKQDYVSLSDRRVSTLNAEKREVIYDIFQNYEKMKMELGEFDLADLVIDIHLRLKNDNLLGDKMDFVYIDEVQDLTMRQIALFKYICENVEQGFVFAGDTAQTIARGIDFRFEDIRSLFYNEFLMKSENCDFGGRREKGQISDIFNLFQNFRTHAGVLRLAQSVINLMCHFFPQSVDVLAPETSHIYGEPPVLLEPGSDENSIITIFGHSKNSGEKWVGFGADQVILVRDDSVRKEISKFVGHQALVLTIVECKGLEFQDVLLYNFFGSSPLINQWRVVYEFLKQNDLLDTNSPESFPSFTHSRHNILCSELKQLYVAITRTRQRLWICENNEELSKPMFDYWMRLCLVQVRKVDDACAQAMQRASTPEEWKIQGIKLFWEKNYEMATMCFEKAGEEVWEKRAKASGLRAASDNLRGSNASEANIMLKEAAEIFNSIGRAESAAECFCDLGDYERAGRIYLEKCGVSEIRKAGECFSLAGLYKITAEVYCKGNFFADCLSACIKGKYFDMGLQYIESWKNQASWNTVIMASLKEIDKIGQEFLESCAHECHRTKTNNASFMKFVRAFHTMESKRSFLRTKDCLEELLILEEEYGNFNEAAEIAKQLGDLLRAADLLAKAENCSEASSLIISYVLSNSLWVKSFPQKEELLTKAMSFAEKVSKSFHALVCLEAKILSTEQRTLMDLMCSYYATKQVGSRINDILSVTKLLDFHFQVPPGKYEWKLEFPFDPKWYSEEILLRKQVSVGTLVFAWNLYKDNVMEVLEFLNSIESCKDFNKVKGTLEFCLKYFGVRLSNNGTYLLLIPQAAWVKNVDERFLRKNRNMVFLEPRHFRLAAGKYWQQELVSVGLRVLECLRSLYMVKSLSKYYQSTCLICIFSVAKFFMSETFDIKKYDLRMLQDFMQFATEYFGIVFPLNPRQSLSEDMISLREAEASKFLLEEVMSRNINTRSVLSYGQIGKIVMIWLGSGTPTLDLYEKLVQRCGENLSWKPFIEILGFSTSLETLSDTLFIALEKTYNANWRMKDYISPNCFLYLLERLLILVPHSRGFFYATKSSFVEWLIPQQSDVNPTASLSSNQYSTGIIFNFVADVIQRFLYDSRETAEWIRNSGMDCTYYFPILKLRLLMILCLLCLNSEMYFNILSALLNVANIRSQLPRGFCEAIGSTKKFNSKSNVAAAFARGFKIIGDPIVIVAMKENNREFMSPDAIFLDLKTLTSKQDIMKTLFPKSTESKSVEGKASITLPAVTSKTESKLNGKGSLQMNWEVIRGIFDLSESLKHGKDGNWFSLVIKKKVEMKELMDCLADAVVRFTEQRSRSNEGERILSDASKLIEELKQISSMLYERDFDTGHFLAIQQIFADLESRSPQIDTLLGLLFMQNDTNESVVSEGINERDISNNNHGAENSDANDSAVAVKKQSNLQASECSKGKGKNKNRKGKNRKGGKKK
ncbi:hypothetical protein ACJIZ3_009790 [Penstemon smallii]|uniref:UvrD-like helicase ATP-binding domain-containing protein n=1 Tax=Penstemon smallii TaxID=265156 RepID=A0ABD3TDI3_9LAMI